MNLKKIDKNVQQNSVKMIGNQTKNWFKLVNGFEFGNINIRV